MSMPTEPEPVLVTDELFDAAKEAYTRKVKAVAVAEEAKAEADEASAAFKSAWSALSSAVGKP